MALEWPEGFSRIPEGDWTHAPVEDLAQGYDTVEDHGWYANLDPTVDALADRLKPGDILVDYSGGTGILADRLLARIGERAVGILIVDSSRKFLRLALDKLGDDERVAFAHVPYLKDEGRVRTMQEVLDPALLDRGVQALVSTNAIHLYHGLDATLASWHDLLVPGGYVHVQSGNIDLPAGGGAEDAWIIDRTVEAIAEEAKAVVQETEAYQGYRDVLDEADRMTAYRDLRERFFLPVKPLEHYTDALQGAGVVIDEVTHREVTARVDEWFEFLSVYHEGVLGWIGGSPRVEDAEPSEEAVEDRLAVMREAMDRVFEGKESFQTVWTYIEGHRA